jgi:hypothetical protein
MQKFLTFMLPVFAALIITFPFMALEFKNQHYSARDFPVALFAFLSAVSAVIALLWMSILRSIKTAGNRLLILARFTLLLSLAILWWEIVNDQLPCFLGVPNCD